LKGLIIYLYPSINERAGTNQGNLDQTSGGHMIENPLTDKEKNFLLKLARQSIEAAVNRKAEPPLDPVEMTPRLMENGAAFVTLTSLQGDLRGCIGALEPYQPLAEDVREHAAAAAMEDPRFPPVKPGELPAIHIEISCLTKPEPLSYEKPEELSKLLKPGVDGVMLRDGFRRATFLPQVWEKIPNVEEFLANLCYKMGAPFDLWRRKKLEVLIYHVEEFHE
jgi:AmmeMemoRadiSam system protein A